MTKKFIFTIVLSLIVTAACSPTIPNTAVPAVANTPIADIPNPTTPTATLTPQPQSTSTPEPQSSLAPQPQAPLVTQQQTDCTNNASFVSDVTIPDNTNINQGSTFEKTWRIRNTGTCTWNDHYSMIFVNGDQMNSIASIPFKETPPGGTLDLSVDLVAPSADGNYTGNYELHNAARQMFLIDNTRYVWVKIAVKTGAAQLPAPTGKASILIPPSGTATATKSPATGIAGNCTYTEDANLRNDLLSLINAARAANSLPALKLNSKLSAAAMSHSIDMACHSSLSHTGSNGSSITDRFNTQGYAYSYWNEAIYAQPPQYGGNAQAAVDWWLNDATHRPILLSPVATDIGTGYASVDSSALGGYFTVDVGAP
jgi:uncharacterized protein YkwD